MDFECFLEYVKRQKCRIIKDKQKSLYQAVRKYGYQSPNIVSVIQSSCPPIFREKMLKIIKVIPLKKQLIDGAALAHSLAEKFIDQMFMRSIDLIHLVRFIKDNNEQKIEKMAEIYGLQQQYKNDLEDLTSKIRQVQIQLQQSNSEEYWKQFQEALLIHHEKYSSAMLIIQLQGLVIDSPNKLRQLSQKYNIFLFKKMEFILFDTISHLGQDHDLSMKIINKSSYKAFKSDIIQLCSKISVLERPNISAQNAMEAEQMVKMLKEEFMMRQQDIMALIKFFYQNDKQKQKKLIQQYGLEVQIELLRKNLVNLAVDQNCQLHRLEVQKVILYFMKLLEINNVKPEKPELMDISEEIESQLHLIKKSLIQEMYVQQADVKDLITSYFSNNTANFQKIVQQYALEDITIEITQILDKLLLGLSPSEQAARKAQIYFYLDFSINKCRNAMHNNQKKLIESNSRKSLQQIDKRQKETVCKSDEKSSVKHQNIIKTWNNFASNQVQETICIQQSVSDSDYYYELTSMKIEQSQSLMEHNKDSNQYQNLKNNDKFRQQNQDNFQREGCGEIEIESKIKISRNALIQKQSLFNLDCSIINIRQNQFNHFQELLIQTEGMERNSNNLFLTNENEQTIILGGRIEEVTVQMSQPSKYNPFQIHNSGNYIGGHKFIKVLIICLSENEIHHIKLQQKQENNVVKFSIDQSSFMNMFSTLIISQLSEQHKYKLQLNFSYFDINIKTSYNGCRILVIKVSQNKDKCKNQDETLVFALFESIKFLIQTVLMQNNIQEDIITWLKLLYEEYKFINEEKLQKIISAIEMAKEFAQLNSMFFIYFFNAIYGEKTYYDYEKYLCNRKLQFFSNKLLSSNTKSPQILQFFNFYLRIWLYDALKNANKYGQYVQKILLMNIRQQPQNHIGQILVSVANKFPRILMKVDKNIIQLFKEKQSLCGHTYFTIRIKYLKFSLDQTDTTQQQAKIMEFMADLVDLYSKFNHLTCKKKVEFLNTDIEDIFLSPRGFFKFNRNLRVGNANLLQLFSQSKILFRLSEGQFNFLGIIYNFMQTKMQILIKDHLLALIRGIITNPYTDPDIELLSQIYQNKALHSFHLKQLIVSIMEDKQRYNIEKFESIITNLIQRGNFIMEPQIILIVDELHAIHQHNNHNKYFLHRLFIILTKNQKIFNSSTLSSKLFRRSLDTYYRIKNQRMQQIYIQNLFAELKLKYANKKKKIMDEIDAYLSEESSEREEKKLFLMSCFDSN